MRDNNYGILLMVEFDDNVVVDKNNVDDDANHLMRNGGDEGIGPVTAGKMEIATVHKVQPGNSSSVFISCLMKGLGGEFNNP